MLLFYQSNPIAFLPFSLTSPSSLLKLLNGAVRLCKPTGAMESLSALSARFCVLLLIYILSVFTWRHSGHIGFPKQWNGDHVGVPNKSCGGWTLFLCKTFLVVPINLQRCWPREWIRFIHNTRTFFPWILMRILFATVSIIPMWTPNRAKNASIMPNTWHTGMIARYTATEVTQYNKMTLQSYLKRV